jgi:LRR receptor-like serine/threonine-protein kinase FLS2
MVQCYMASLDVANVSNITTDQSALLALKAQISYDPRNVLSNNWSTGTFVCNWVGVTCDSRHQRVTALNLSYMGLVSTIPPHIGNLSSLLSLNIENNSFHGSLPNELSHLYNLQHLSFGFNNFNGKIPSTLFKCKQLQYLSFTNNDFTGSIPSDIGNLIMLTELYFDNNNFEGMFSISLCKYPIDDT